MFTPSRWMCRVALLIAAASLQVLPARAGWLDSGTPVVETEAVETCDAVLALEGSGCIVVWRVAEAGYDLRVQRLDGRGMKLWGTSGVSSSGVLGAPHADVQLVTDGAGGAIVVWSDARTGDSDVYAQRITANGDVLWGAGGRSIGPSSVVRDRPLALADGEGGVIVIWRDDTSEGMGDIYGQCLDADGSATWLQQGMQGIIVAAANGEQTPACMVPDGQEGVVIVWADSRNALQPRTLLAQRLSPSGDRLWDPLGAYLALDQFDCTFPVMVNDGTGGVVVAWTNAAGNGIVGQRLDATTGQAHWNSFGLQLSTANSVEAIELLVDEAGGTFLVHLAHVDGGDEAGVYAQRIANSGVVQWGTLVGNIDQTQKGLAAVGDGHGGFFASWEDLRDGTADWNVYAQRVDTAGEERWGAGGVAVCTATEDQRRPRIARDASNGLILAWDDFRFAQVSSADVYAQRIGPEGNPDDGRRPLLLAVTDVPRDQGGRLLVRWEASVLDRAPQSMIAHYSIWRRLDLARPVASSTDASSRYGWFVGFAAEAPVIRTHTDGYAWEWLTNVLPLCEPQYAAMVSSLYDSTASGTGEQAFLVVAHGLDFTEYFTSNVAYGYSVDDLAPNAPTGLVGRADYDPLGLTLSWSWAPESDFAQWNVYRGLDASFVPSSASWTASVTVPTWFDSSWSQHAGYHYKIGAVDVHGNEAAHASLAPSEVTGVDGITIPTLVYLRQNVPNPFNPSTLFEFGLEDDREVCLSIHDLSGRSVRVLLDARLAAGVHRAVWDGCDQNRRPAASGIYVCRLRSGAVETSVKVTLLR
jgi:hypothetical protein